MFFQFIGYHLEKAVRLILDVQGQEGGRILDVYGQRGVEGLENWTIFLDVIYVSSPISYTMKKVLNL